MYAVAIPFYGRLADLHGARRFFLFGQAVFAIGSLLCAIAPSFQLLLVARVIQASGGAAVPGLGIALAARAFPPHQRGTVLGTVTSVLGVAAAVGPTLGGVMADRFGWHAVFALGILAGFILPASWLLLPRDSGRDGDRLDFWGGLFLAGAISGGLLALTEGSRAGWSTPRPLIAAAFGVAGLVALVVRQRTAESPFIPRELLGNRRYVALVAASFGASTAMMGTLIGMPLLLATVNGHTPTEVGLALLPNAAIFALLGVLVGRLVDRAGALRPVRIGLIIMILAAIGLSWGAGSSIWTMAAILSLLGLGSSLVNTPLGTAVSLVVPPRLLASGQSMNTMLFFLGGSLGATAATAIVGARVGALDAVNPLHTGAAIGFSDAFLLSVLPLVIALALSGAIPGPQPRPGGPQGRPDSTPEPSATSPEPTESRTRRTSAEAVGAGRD